MAIDYRFVLHYNDESLEIEEPKGFGEIELSMKRDDKMHGMNFDASTSSLQFFGEAADILREQKRLYGLNSNVILQAFGRCDDTTPEEEVLKGRLNFGKFKEECGTVCSIFMPVESETCEVTLKNRFDQKVDIDLAKGSDQFTVLPSYTGLAQEKTLLTKDLFVAVRGYVADDKDIQEIQSNSIDNEFIWSRPVYARELYNSIDTGELVPGSFYQSGVESSLITPQLLYEDNVKCFLGFFDYTFRFKGRLQVANVSNRVPKLMIVTWDGEGDIFSDSTVLQEEILLNEPIGLGDVDVTFDHTFTGSIIPAEGIGIYGFLFLPFGFTGGEYVYITYEPETYVDISTNKACPPTTVDLYLVHETLSRATESITDYCMRVKSEYYGRTDSQPFAFDDDGCGGLRFLTSGLKIRKAIEDKFFVSLKELVEGLQNIDNIGMGVEQDELRPGQFVLRIEELDFFYTNEEILYHEGVPKADHEIDEQKHYSRILVGYKKWEVQRINGLDEFNSNREFRTSLSSVSNILDITSGLIAGGYPIEVTRQQSFAESGGADTTYDNEIFIITGTRDAYGIEPEQGNITDAENIYSPETAYNFRLSPLRNLMRWYRSIVNSYANVVDSVNKLLFSSGTGNLVAKGMVTPGTYDASCIMENQAISENQNLFTNYFQRAADYTPLWRNETVTYEYPMSIGDYRTVKANPYGYISYQCGNGDFQKGYIKEIKYKPAEGMATFILKKKWE